jgi:hypothetical protein
VTVAEIFKKAKLSTCKTPMPWGTEIPEASAGVYVVARAKGPKSSCKSLALPPFRVIPTPLDLDLEYEKQRWLPNEPVLYIGKTDQPLLSRVRQFYSHECGRRSPHAGGQVVKLLDCDLWVYWAAADDPYASEQMMISAFKKDVGKVPFANYESVHRRRRIIAAL